MNEDHRKIYLDQTIRHLTDRLQAAEQELVEYRENTPNPVASRIQVLRVKIERARDSLDTFVVQREHLLQERSGLRRRVRSRSPTRRLRSRSRGRSSSRDRSRSRGRSSSRSRSRSQNRGNMPPRVFAPPNRTRRRSRCPQGSNCTVS